MFSAGLSGTPSPPPEGIIPPPPPITDEIIAEMGLAYLKQVGSVDRKDIIFHDFCEGAKAYRERLKTMDL